MNKETKLEENTIDTIQDSLSSRDNVLHALRYYGDRRAAEAREKALDDAISCLMASEKGMRIDYADEIRAMKRG